MSEVNGVKKSGKVYAELLCDFMFKRLFGSEANKDVLIWFLNMILEDVVIEDVDFIPTEHLGLSKEDRKAVFDISCRCSNGETLIIEMQKGYQEHFRKRAIYYTSYPIIEQGRKAKEAYIKEHQCKIGGEEFRWDFNLKPVMVVAILNFKFDHTEGWPQDRYHSSYRLREDYSNEVMTDVLRYVFLELGRFRKHLWELETAFDKWMYLFKHMHEMVEIPAVFQTSEFNRLFILSKIGNFTAEEYKEYENSLTHMSDYYNIINSAEKIAREEGREIGREIGREEAKIETAVKMKQMGIEVNVISQVTGLTSDVILGLQV